MDFLKRQKVNSIIFSVVMIVFGFLFCFMPITTLNIIETIVLIFLICYGIVYLMAYCFSPFEFRDTSMLTKAVISLILGFLLIFVSSFFVFIVGLFVAYNGIERIIFSLNLKKNGDKKWIYDFVLGALVAALGLISMILCWTSIAEKALMIYFGISLILDGISNLILLLVVGHQIKGIKIKQQSKKDDDFKDYEVK